MPVIPTHQAASRPYRNNGTAEDREEELARSRFMVRHNKTGTSYAKACYPDPFDLNGLVDYVVYAEMCSNSKAKELCLC